MHACMYACMHVLCVFVIQSTASIIKVSYLEIMYKKVESNNDGVWSKSNCVKKRNCAENRKRRRMLIGIDTDRKHPVGSLYTNILLRQIDVHV